MQTNTFASVLTYSGFFFLALSSSAHGQTPLSRAPWGRLTLGPALEEIAVEVWGWDTGKRASDIACNGSSLWAIGVTPTGAGNLDMFSFDLPADRMYVSGKYLSKPNVLGQVTQQPYGDTAPPSFPTTPLPVQAVKVAVDSAGTPWVLTAQGQIWKRNLNPSIRWDLAKMATVYSPGDPPEAPPEPAYTAFAAAGNTIWAVGTAPGMSFPAGYGGIFFAGQDREFRRLSGPNGNQGVKDLTIDSGPDRILGPTGEVIYNVTAVAPTVYVTAQDGKLYRLGTDTRWTESVRPANLTPMPSGCSKTAFCGAVPWLINQSTGNVWMGFRHADIRHK